MLRRHDTTATINNDVTTATMTIRNHTSDDRTISTPPFLLIHTPFLEDLSLLGLHFLDDAGTITPIFYPSILYLSGAISLFHQGNRYERDRAFSKKVWVRLGLFLIVTGIPREHTQGKKQETQGFGFFSILFVHVLWTVRRARFRLYIFMPREVGGAGSQGVLGDGELPGAGEGGSSRGLRIEQVESTS